jgi:uncharacterized delta-60 repeat protein
MDSRIPPYVAQGALYYRRVKLARRRRVLSGNRRLAFWAFGTLLAVPVVAWARPGDLDPTFGTAGTVKTAVGAPCAASALALQPDGAVVAAGKGRTSDAAYDDDFALVRYAADGTLDGTFGSGGVVVTPLGTSVDGYDQAFGLVLQPDGNLVAAGYGSDRMNDYFQLIRYNADGSLDSTFGSGGVVKTPVDAFSEAHALIRLPDGDLVAAGMSHHGSTPPKFALARYNPDGSLDGAFGTGGMVTTAIGTVDDRAYDVVVQPDGKLVALGTSATGRELHDPRYFALVRYEANGTLDGSFGTGGIVTTPVTTPYGSSRVEGRAVVLQPDHKIVAAGFSAFDSRTVLARYNPDGSLDPTFGNGGVVIDKPGATALLLEPDGKLITARGSLSRFNADGSRDETFGNGGVVTSTFGGEVDVYNEIRALALQPDGKLVATGVHADVAGGSWFAAARYQDLFCGNGTIDYAEQCDDGNVVDGDGCDSNCTPTACGNGVVSSGEECDDGNLTSGDGCSATCEREVFSHTLVLRQAAAGPVQRAKVTSLDEGLSLGGGNFSADDPVANGGSLRIVSAAGGFDNTFPLPAGNWKYLGTPGNNTGYKYSNTAGPIRTITIRNGRIRALKVNGRGGLGLGLGSNPSPVGVALTTGSRVYCFSFGAKVTFRPNHVYKANSGPAPGACTP